MTEFTLKLLLSGVLGGAWVTGVTMISERFGSKIGGLAGGLPSTVLFTYFFIAWTQGAEQGYAATTPFPIAYSFNVIGILVYCWLVHRSFALAFSGFMLSWFLTQGFLVLTNFDSYPISLAVWAFLFVASYFIFEKGINLKSQAKVAIQYTRKDIINRALISGFIIMLAVVMSKIGGPLLGGIFAAMPGVFISTMILTYRSAGAEFSRVTLATMLISGMINCVTYVAVFRHFVLQWNLFLTVLFAILATLVSAYISHQFIQKKMS